MTKYLLDTHVVLWIANNSPMLSNKAKEAILNIDTQKYVSIVSIWEVAIKIGTKKLNLIGGLPEFYKMVEDNGFLILPIEREYLLQIPNLPDYHKDPFDRMIITTAVTENMILITADENIHKYKLSLLW